LTPDLALELGLVLVLLLVLLLAPGCAGAPDVLIALMRFLAPHSPLKEKPAGSHEPAGCIQRQESRTDQGQIWTGRIR
jgi:hypothetical protein